MDEDNIKINGVPIAGLLSSIFNRLTSKAAEQSVEEEIDGDDDDDEDKSEMLSLPSIWMISRGQLVKDPEVQKHVIAQIVQQITRHECGFSAEAVSIIASLFRVFLSSMSSTRSIMEPILCMSLKGD
jgi:hypothetical protein